MPSLGPPRLVNVHCQLLDELMGATRNLGAEAAAQAKAVHFSDPDVCKVRARRPARARTHISPHKHSLRVSICGF